MKTIRIIVLCLFFIGKIIGQSPLISYHFPFSSAMEHFTEQNSISSEVKTTIPSLKRISTALETKDINTFPNPSRGRFIIQLGPVDLGLEKIRVLTLKGK